jgi:hypothetical protein
MTSGIHALVQNADNGDAVARRPEIDDMQPGAASPIAWPDIAASLRLLRRFGQFGASGFDKIGVAHGLGQTPARYSIVKHPIKIALSPWAEPIFSQAARPYVA